MAICPNCGNTTDLRSRYCADCGASVFQEAETPRLSMNTDQPGHENIHEDTGCNEPAPGGMKSGSKRPHSRKIDLYPKIRPDERNLFRIMFFLITDSEMFFSRVDMEKQLFQAAAFLFILTLFNLAGIYFLFVFIGRNDLITLRVFAALAVIIQSFPFMISVVGMVLLSLLHKGFFSWKRIYCIYAFSSFPLAFSWWLVFLGGNTGMSFLPVILLLYPFLYICFRYCRTGFVNVFGLDYYLSTWYSVLLPLITCSLIGTAIYEYYF